MQLVTLKYTQYGGEGYLRDGVEGFFVRENSSADSGRRPGQAAFLFCVSPTDTLIRGQFQSALAFPVRNPSHSPARVSIFFMFPVSLQPVAVGQQRDRSI